MTLTPTLVFWLLIVTIILLVAWLVHLSQRLNREVEQRAGLQTWAGFRDPDYWRERLGTEDGPFVNEEPKPEGPVNCEDGRGFHLAGPGGLCQDCKADLVKPATNS